MEGGKDLLHLLNVLNQLSDPGVVIQLSQSLESLAADIRQHIEINL